MTDERIDPIGSVTPEPTCTECRAPAAVGRIAVVRTLLCPASGLWTGRPRFPMQWRGSESPHHEMGDIP